VVIVSASYEQYVRVVGDHLGVDAVIATRLEVESERCTGRLLGANCRGPEKLVRLRGWLASQGLDLDDVTLWAYGDSTGDRELLAAADHPHWVRQPLDSVAPAF
jgi:phosphatidylglycerophosphatase C